MNIVIALDSFKGSLAAGTACRIAAEAFARVLPAAQLRCVPMADGGEGTADTLVEACGGVFITLTEVCGPLPGQRMSVRYGWLPDTRTAVVEMAQASGLPLVPLAQRDPRITSTRGTGQMMAHALRHGAARLVLTLGGSATNDGGTGAAAALGWRFLDANGRDLPDGGGALHRLARILPPTSPLPQVTVDALCDVDNLLYGSRGAAAVYGPQKGATPAMVEELDSGLRVLAGRILVDLGVDVAALPGGGAAGGFGAGAVAFFGAHLVRGVEQVADLVGLAGLTRQADWVITGEGRFDDQSLQGKVASGVLRLAAQSGARVAVLAGSVAMEPACWRAAGVQDAEACAPVGMPDEEAICHASELLATAAERLACRLQSFV